MTEVPHALDQLHRQGRKDLVRGARRVAVSGATLAVALGAAHFSHTSPDFFLQHGIPMADGIGHALYSSADAVGGFINRIAPFAKPTSQAVAELEKHTPVGEVLNSNLVADVEVLTGLRVVREGIHVGRRGLDRYVTHHQTTTDALQAGKADESIPAHVRHGMKAVGIARGVLTAADSVLEVGEVAAEGPIPYGLRDLDSALFFGMKWHPVTGEMTKVDRAVLALSIAIPYVPPIFIFGPYAWTKHLFKGNKSGNKAH